MENLKDQKIGSLVTENYRYADIFKKHNIDFCCGGGISVEEACRKKGLDQDEIISELQAVEQRKSPTVDFKNWELDKLAEHIVSAHHGYVREALPLLTAYSTKVAQVHGKEHPETEEVKKLVDALASELFPHMNKEEIVLFPYIKSLVNANRIGNSLDAAPFGSVQNPVRAMMVEHDTAGDIMKTLASLTTNYSPPVDACNTYSVLYQKLEEFQNDLFLHIHLENNILFPKALELENHVIDNDHARS